MLIARSAVPGLTDTFAVSPEYMVSVVEGLNPAGVAGMMTRGGSGTSVSVSIISSILNCCMNTCTQCMSVIYANITLTPQEYFLSAQHRHVDTIIANVILQKGTRGSFRQWDSNYQCSGLSVTRLQMFHAVGGYGMTPNTIEQTSAKVVMTSRFLCLVGSLSPYEQNLWLPNPDTWTTRPRYVDHTSSSPAQKRVCDP